MDGMKSKIHSIHSVHAVGSRSVKSRPFFNFIQSVAIFSIGCALYFSPVVQNHINKADEKIKNLAWVLSNTDAAPLPKNKNTFVSETKEHSQFYVALLQEGGVNYNSAKTVAQKNSLSPQETVELLDLLKSSDSYLIFGGDYREALDEENENRKKSLEEINNKFLSAASKKNKNVQSWGVLENWFGAQEEIYQTDVFEQTKISLSGALEELQGAVSESGLVFVQIPPTAQNNPTAILALAEKIKSFNKSLGDITGFSGATLGLNGRVALRLLSAIDNAETIVSKSGTIHIFGDWSTAPHEWFHALDCAMASNSPGVRPLKPLSSQSVFYGSSATKNLQDNLYAGLSNPVLTKKDLIKIQKKLQTSQFDGTEKNIFKAVEEARKNIIQNKVKLNGSPWITWRTYASTMPSAKKSKETSSYLKSKSEILAVSFAGYASESSRELFYDFDAASGIYLPTEVEIKAVKKYWKSFMSSSAPWWESDRQARGFTSSRRPGHKF